MKKVVRVENLLHAEGWGHTQFSGIFNVGKPRLSHAEGTGAKRFASFKGLTQC